MVAVILPGNRYSGLVLSPKINYGYTDTYTTVNVFNEDRVTIQQGTIKSCSDVRLSFKHIPNTSYSY